MGHKDLVSGYPKSTGIMRVDRLSTGPLGFGVSQGFTCLMLIIEAFTSFPLFPYVAHSFVH